MDFNIARSTNTWRRKRRKTSASCKGGEEGEGWWIAGRGKGGRRKEEEHPHHQISIAFSTLLHCFTISVFCHFVVLLDSWNIGQDCYGRHIRAISKRAVFLVSSVWADAHFYFHTVSFLLSYCLVPPFLCSLAFSAALAISALSSRSS